MPNDTSTIEAGAAHVALPAGSATTSYRIVQIRPAEYAHADALTELAEAIYFGLRRLGVPVYYREPAPAAARDIIFGGHLLQADGIAELPSDAILYNTEQIFAESPWLSRPYMRALQQHRVWDYSEDNARRLQTFGVANIRHVPLGYVPELVRIPSATEDIDVLFYGSINRRREAVLQALERRGVKVVSLFDKYGEERDRFIARAKIVLNVHFYETKVFEMIRCAYLLTNSKAVVAECDLGTSIEPRIRKAVRGVPYPELVDACVDLLRDDGARRSLGALAYEIFAVRSQESILAEALELPHAPADARSIVPRTLHVGSGKDFRSDALNLDMNAAWAPDAVLDISDPALVGRTVDTQRFGPIRLQEGNFDCIVANDVLEHIPDLVSAMTNCLRLLRPGGRFQIGVPYDLSHGAWQDPTHVRAFNENSWLYYTDWHWYLGWTGMRFDLIRIDFQPSAVGAEMIKSGRPRDEIMRTPRAIDYMHVTLRKRYLQESERREAAARQPGRRATAEALQ